MNKFRGFFALLLAGATLGSFSIWIRFLNTDLGPFQQIVIRNIIAVLLSALLILGFRRKIDFKQTPKKYLLAYTFAFPLSIVFFTLSVVMGKIITAIFGLYLASFMISLVVGITVFKEKVTSKKIFALALVLVALFVYTSPFSLKNFLDAGFLFGVLAGCAEATANSFRKYLGGKLDKLVLVAVQGLGALILGIVLVVAAGQLSLPAVSTFNWFILFIFGSLLVLMTYLTLVGFSNFDLNLGTVVISSELFFGPLFAFAVFAEAPTFLQTIGALLIMGAIVVLNVDFKYFKKKLNYLIGF
ncbi:MAG: DMT family transporter [Patescibacteria group bacterium]